MSELHPVHSDYDPLILLYTTSVMAAFAFSNGDANKSYDILYDNFKKYFTRRDASQALDVAFVFCVHSDARNMDLLCSRVETDVYFCRKFVVRLALPLNKSLARLPFLPLSPLGTQSLRPPSAQTYLQRCGVPATLAKYLVVQRERSPARIVDDCVSGAFGEPRELIPTALDPVTMAERTANPIRFENILISDFRAYRKPQTFRLGADVTVLYGPNGFGKTSLFDAIDFVVTGEIGRMKSSSDVHFKKVTKHLDSGPDDGMVALSFRSNDEMRTLERRVSNRKQAMLDGHPTERKKVLRELTSGEFPSTDRIENFVSLFRATHLFSQEHQELMIDFHDDCELSDRIVSRLLAFEDYANAANKTDKVREILKAAVDSANREYDELLRQISEENREIDRLSRTVEAPRSLGELRDAIESLRVAISDAGLSVTTSGSDLDAVREWRAAIEMRQATAQTQSERLSALAKDAAVRPKLVIDLERVSLQVEDAECALDAQRKKHGGAREELQQVKRQLEKIAAARVSVQERTRVLGWVRSTSPAYADLVRMDRSLTDDLEGANATLALLRTSEAVGAKELLTVANRVKETQRNLNVAQTYLDSLQELSDTTTTWQTNNNRLIVLANASRDEHGALELLKSQESDLLSKQKEVLTAHARLVRHIADVDRGQSELRQLLLQLKGRVHDGTCPLCGEEHGSIDALLLRIEKRIVADEASAARIELRRMRGSVESLSEQLESCRSQRTETDAGLVSIAKEKMELRSQVAKSEELAKQLDVVINDNTMRYVEQRCNEVKQEVAKWSRDIETLNGEVRSRKEKLEYIREQIEQAVTKKSETAVSLKSTQEEMSRLREDPRWARISLEVDLGQLVELECRNAEETTVVNEKLKAAEDDVAETEARLVAIRKEENFREAEVNRLRNRVAKLKRETAELDARLEEAGLGPDVEEDTVNSELVAESQAQAQFLALRNQALALELAIDRATTAAALSQLRQNLQDKQRVLAITKQKGIRHGSWVTYFGVLARLISSQRNEATEDFTREYGPRTSVIQRRLRSVYGFDDVEIHSHESTIRVRVKRRDENLRPTDYFSQSQQQTLLLGLFLTTCLSQTWSSLSPVLLDDPVTHFDDLNTYAFLDLVSGLVELESGGRQFIVSTCDEKFLQLARQKFRHLGDRATFYEFSAIDENGPAVELLASHNMAGV